MKGAEGAEKIAELMDKTPQRNTEEVRFMGRTRSKRLQEG